ncbi:MAG: AEC family transporter [Kiritimatiellia bacterium]|jgi:predicted permease
MFESLLVVGHQVAVLFILIALGCLCNKLKILDAQTVAGLTDLVLYIVTPCIIIVSFQREFNRSMLGGLALAFFIGVTYHLLNIAFAHTLVHDAIAKRQKVLRFALVFSNAGFMGFPLQQALLGDEGVFYGAAVVAVFNLMVWSYGLVLMSGETRGINARKLLLNPGVTSVIIGIALFATSFKLPAIVLEPMQAMANLNTPVPMLIIGYYLADANLKSVMTDAKVYGVMALRLIVVPLLLLGVLLLTGFHGQTTLVVACIIAASAPSAALTTMFSTKFNQDTILSVGIVSYSTMLSMATMPVVVGLARHLTS